MAPSNGCAPGGQPAPAGKRPRFERDLPRLPLTRLFLALAMVPGMYVLLALCGAAVVAVAVMLVLVIMRRSLLLVGVAVVAGGAAVQALIAVAIGLARSLWMGPTFEPVIPLPLAREPALAELVRETSA